MTRAEMHTTCVGLVKTVADNLGWLDRPLVEALVTDAVNSAWRNGYEAGRASAGQPSLAEGQCPGGREAPAPGTVRRGCSGHPGRGCCSVCGTDLKLTWAGLVRRHKRKP